MQSTQDTRDPMAGFMGYSPSPSASASSSSNGPRSGSNDSGHNSSNGAGSATGMGRTNSYGLSPSAMDPNTFSGQFTTPRFATGGQSDPYGFGVAVVDAQRYVLLRSLPEHVLDTVFCSLSVIYTFSLPTASTLQSRRASPLHLTSKPFTLTSTLHRTR